jgi:hypothetical protein
LELVKAQYLTMYNNKDREKENATVTDIKPVINLENLVQYVKLDIDIMLRKRA